MKRLAWMIFLILALSGGLVACGGGGTETTVEPAVDETTTDTTAAEPAADEAAEPAEETAATEETAAEAEPPAEEAAAAEGAAEEAPVEGEAAGGDLIAGRPASGTDPDTGLEINPAAVVPGVDFIVRGEIVNANLAPQETPEFVVLAPSGTRFRIRSQHVKEIFYDDGTQPALHEFQRGVLLQATVRQEEDAGATITVNSTDLTLLHSE